MPQFTLIAGARDSSPVRHWRAQSSRAGGTGPPVITGTGFRRALFSLDRLRRRTERECYAPRCIDREVGSGASAAPRSSISFTKRWPSRHRLRVRTLWCFTAVFVLGASAARAQMQERKLLDRLLEPN